MFRDFISADGQAHGPVAERLQGCHYDAGLLRPYYDDRGRKCATVNTGRLAYDKESGEYNPVREQELVSNLERRGIDSPVFNQTTLRKDEWIQMDRKVLRATRLRLRAWSDLAAANTYSLNGMSNTILEHEMMSDPGEAVVDMDAITEGPADRPRYKRQGLPLPITHCDFWFTKRNLAVGRNAGTPLEFTMAEACGRRVAEMVERTVIGVQAGMNYGNNPAYEELSTVWGYMTHPHRITFTTLTAPTGLNSATTLAEVLEMRDLLYAAGFTGPFMLYHSNNWDQYMDNDYYVTGTGMGGQTLRDRLRSIEDIRGVRRLDYFNVDNSMLLVQMTSDVAQAVNGMDLTTIQWDVRGGMQINFMVMAIWVPRIRADFNDNCGIVHATTS